MYLVTAGLTAVTTGGEAHCTGACTSVCFCNEAAVFWEKPKGEAPPTAIFFLLTSTCVAEPPSFISVLSGLIFFYHPLQSDWPLGFPLRRAPFQVSSTFCFSHSGIRSFHVFLIFTSSTLTPSQCCARLCKPQKTACLTL